MFAKLSDRAGRRVWSIRWIVTSVAVLLTILAVLSVGAVADRNARQALDRELQSRTLLLARNLALTSAGALLTDFPELTLQPVVRQLLDRQPELAFAAVVDHEGRIQAHPDVARLDTPYVPEVSLSVIPSPGAHVGDGEVLRGGGHELFAEVPVRSSEGERIIGRAYVSLQRDYVESALAASRRQQLLVMLAFLAVGIAAAFVLMSALLRPIAAIRAGLQRIGQGDLDSPIASDDRTELGLLAGTVNEMTAALRRARAEMVERERLGRELELAHEIQLSIMPSRPVEAAPFLIRWNQRTAAEVGGDYYDVLRRSDGRIAIAMADVAGKGLAGCMVMAMLSSLLRALRDRYDSPSELLVELDARLCESLSPGVFVTLFYGILDPETGRFIYASAGHNPLLIVRSGRAEVETLATKGIPLAAIRGGVIRCSLQDQEVTLAPGDMAIQYTDGFTEAFAAATQEEFGLSRLSAVLQNAAPRGADVVMSRLHAAIQDWTGGAPPEDDESILILSAELPAPIERSSPDPADRSALDALHSAEAGGVGLTLQASLDSLHSIRPWLACIPALRDLAREEMEWLTSALYEAGANIAEHGFAGRTPIDFQLWWLTGEATPPVPGETAEARASRLLRTGTFIIRDEGAQYQPEAWSASDFEQPDVRRRGRGIGLDIIHNVMRGFGYRPGTARGNITSLTFGPRRDQENLKESA